MRIGNFTRLPGLELAFGLFLAMLALQPTPRPRAGRREFHARCRRGSVRTLRHRLQTPARGAGR